MFKMENKYDVVETNRISGRYDGTLNRVEFIAGEDLENGRFVVVEDGIAKYASDATKPVYLVTTPERLYQGESIDEFINPKGAYIRGLQLVTGNAISTTAAEAGLKVGDKCTVGAEGKLVAGEEGDILFEVTAKRMLGKEMGITVELL